MCIPEARMHFYSTRNVGKQSRGEGTREELGIGKERLAICIISCKWMLKLIGLNLHLQRIRPFVRNDDG